MCIIQWVGTCNAKKTFVTEIFSPHNCKPGDPEEEMPGSLCLHIRLITVREMSIISEML